MKKHSMSFAAGLLVGAVMFGGSVAYAAGVMAERSTHPIYVDGAQVQIEAYTINGANYVKLRDIGQAVGFNVYWLDGVQVDSGAPYTGESPATASKGGTVTLPTDGTRYIPQAGDVILCDDGTEYTITDVSRWDKNMFASGPVGELPEATCDWSSFPEVELPAPEVRRYRNEYGDYLFIRNLYETRRMQYTLQNLAGNHPDTSEDGRLKYGSKGTPSVRIKLTVEGDRTPQSFWPWRESEIERVFNSCPPGTYYLESWDVYKDGIFQRTQYNIYAI